MQGRKIAPIVAATALGLLAGVAIADSGLTPSRARDELQAAGFTDVRKLHREKDHYDVVAMKDGKEVVLDVDAHSGTITPSSKPPPPRPKPEEEEDGARGREPLPDRVTP